MNRREFILGSAAVVLFPTQTKAALQRDPQPKWVEIARRKISPNANRVRFDLGKLGWSFEHIRFSASGNAVWIQSVTTVHGGKVLNTNVLTDAIGRNIPPGSFSEPRRLQPETTMLLANIVTHPLGSEATELVLWGQR